LATIKLSDDKAFGSNFHFFLNPWKIHTPAQYRITGRSPPRRNIDRFSGCQGRSGTAITRGKITDSTMARRSFPEGERRLAFFLVEDLFPPNRRGRKMMQLMSKMSVRISWIPAN